ncbi:MAG TPA: APC family permease, partial [Armatimonadota bacterium]|nr:APC family permease [Armatimonadota bacterium]
MGLLDITMIGIGAMIGAGIFVLTGIAAGKAGPALIIAFALNGFMAMLTALAYAELGSCFPQAGGGYQWVAEAFPGRIAFLTGWISWLGNSVACSLYVLGFGAYLGEIFRDILMHVFGDGSVLAAMAGHGLFMKAAGVLICATFVYINYRGASETGKAETIATVAKLIILAVFLASGLWALFHKPDWAGAFAPFFPKGWGGVFAAMGLTYIAFEGYEIIAQSGEEVRNPRRNIPMAIIISIVVVIPIYCLVAFVCIGAVTPPPGETVWQNLGKLGELGVVEA